MGNSSDRSPPKRVVRTFLGKGEGWGRNRPDLLGIPPNRQLCSLLTPALDTQNAIDESDSPARASGLLPASK